ncbi:hypothetical protein QNH98_14775 [Myroides sp. mNGS23_01]|nr:hypothetical protein [Myroides sp. mNGS23_01]WHT38295.1 hypothetical protein QNH98_14775 [Myroides sp. mNGS23_01]
MNTFVRLFPDYEDVFFDEIEKHRTYFLPLCSFNLQLIDPRLDQWLHIVSVKEIYDGCIGQNTTPYHRHFTQLDSIGFDIIDGKYKFEGDWNFSLSIISLKQMNMIRILQQKKLNLR